MTKRHVIEIYQFENNRWKKLPLTRVINGDQIIKGRIAEYVSTEKIYITVE